MEMTSAKAKLVGAEGLEPGGDTVTATIPREEIEAALASAEPVDLVLEVARSNGDPAEADRQTVNVAWERDDLEQLLGETPGMAVTFSFRASDLEQALEESEFEGHGLRETVAVLAVAAAAAASASQATAAPIDVGSGGGGAAAVATVHNEAIADARTGAIGTAEQSGPETVIPYLSQGQGVDAGDFGGTPPAPEPTVVPYLSQGQGVDPADFGGTPPTTEPTVVPYLSQGQGVDESQFSGAGTAAASIHDEAGLAARGIESQPSPGPAIDEVGLAARGIETGAVHDEATLAARGIEVDPTAVHDEAGLTARGIEAPVADTGGGFELPTVDPGTAAVVGGVAGGAALLITAAAFAARRRPPVTPA